MSSTAPISRGVLADRVRDRLLEAILTGRYEPGERIIETRVARELGVSQAPVREALRDLEAVGFVEIAAYQGARVRHPGKAELAEAYAIRSVIESLGAEQALPRLELGALADLQARIDEMRDAAMAGDPRREAISDAAFHGRLIELSGNRTLGRVWSSLEPVSRTYLTLGIPGVDVHQIVDLHQPILDALARSDLEGARAAIQRHFAIAGAMFDALFVDRDDDADRPVSHPHHGGLEAA